MVLDMDNQCCLMGGLKGTTKDRARCFQCGSIWYRIDPKERSAQGRKGVNKRWREHKKRKAQAAKRNGGGK